MITSTEIGSKNINSKDYLETKIPIFTTQKKRILEFAKENGFPSKFVIPAFADERQHGPTEISEDYISLYDLIKEKLDKKPISKIVEEIHESYPQIELKEILYAIAELIELTPAFYKQAEIIFPQYRDPEAFYNEKVNYESTNIPQMLEKDKGDLRQIKVFFQNITKIDPVLTSDITITKMTVEFDVVTGQNEDLLQMSPDLFADMKLNFEVPFVQYNDQRISKYKVFNGETFETRPPFKIFENRFDKFVDKNTFYMIVFADYDVEDFTKNSFISAALNLEKSILTFKYLVLSHRSEIEILQAIKSVLPKLKFKNRREKNYGATFNIYNVEIREDSFLDLLLTEPFQPETKNLFGSLIFLDEFEKPVSEKKKMKLYYDTNILFDPVNKEDDLSKIASLGFYMTEYQSGITDSMFSKGRYNISAFERGTKVEDKILGLKNTPYKSTFLENETKYITVNVSKAANRFVLFQFMNVYARLLNIYNQTKDEYEKIYDTLIPDLKDPKTQEDLTLIMKPKETQKEKTSNVNLATIAPEIFTSSYSRDCQFKKQPIIISEEQVAEWKNKKIKYKNKMIERPVEKLGDYYFVCPGDEWPFVGFKKNKDEDRKFPKYPCCYTNPMKEARERETGTTYRSKNPIKTNKVMAEQGLAFLPTAVEEMLRGAFERPVNFFRMGSLVSPNSFLACVLLALQDKQYLKIESLELKEKYLQKVKKAISETANFLVTSSELFDLAEKDRIDLFLKDDEFLNPSLFYRVIEEIFGLNIFVFSSSLPKPNVEPVYNLEISRFSSVPMHSFRKGYPTLVIYKHWGSETDHLEYPQCELVVAGLEELDATLFTDNLAKYLLKGYFISTELFGKIFLSNDTYFENYSSSVIYQLLNNDFVGNFLQPNSPIKAISQFIDEKGKLAGLQLETNKGKMTIGLPPLCPQDLPLAKKIQKSNLSDVLKVFNDQPTGFSYEENQAVAVWFRLLSLEYGIQVPIDPIDRKEIETKFKLPEVPENRFQLQKQKSQIERLFKLQKDVNIIIQLVRWLFLVSLEKREEINLSVDQKLELANEFIEEMIRILPRRNNSDSANVYDFANLPRKLPSIKNTLPVIMREISERAPTFIQEQQILISGKVFYQRIKESLEHFVRLNLPISIPGYLDEYYQSVYDYPKIPKNIVFLSKLDFKRWLKQVKENPSSSYPVFFALKGKLSEFDSPYLYSVELEKPTIENPFGDNFLFLIQNAPFINSKESALENAVQWKKTKVNRPEVSERKLEEFTNYKVFTIGQNEKFQLVEDKAVQNKRKDTLFILRYPNVDRFASILPM